MIRLHCIRAWKVARRRKQRLRAFARKMIEKKRLEKAAFNAAVQSCLVVARSGVVCVCPEAQLVEVYAALSRNPTPLSKEDMLNHLDWWVVDISKRYDNTRKMTEFEKQTYYHYLFEREGI